MTRRDKVLRNETQNAMLLALKALQCGLSIVGARITPPENASAKEHERTEGVVFERITVSREQAETLLLVLDRLESLSRKLAAPLPREEKPR